MNLITDSLRTLNQMPEPAMRSPLIKGVLITFLLMVLLALTIGAWITWLMSSWTIPFTNIAIGTGAGWFAGMGSFAAAFYAFIPAAALAVSFFIDPVADAVEARYYPDAGPARNRPLAEDLWTAAKTAMLALVLNIPLLPFYFLFPPLPAVVNGYLLGREYFSMAALRHNTSRDTNRLRKSARFNIWTGGALLALMMTVPILNLFTPVFGAGLMTHIYNRAEVKAGEL